MLVIQILLIEFIQSQTIIPLITSNSFDYYSIIEIGTPPQAINIQFSTSANATWVATTQCTNQTCQLGQQWFDLDKSNTLELDNIYQDLKYDQMEFLGQLGQDIVSNYYYQSKIQFLFVSKEINFTTDHVDGVIGLSNYPSFYNYVQQSFEQSQIKQNLFGFSYQNRYLYLGQIPQEIENQLIWLNCNRQYFWTIKVIDFLVNDQSYLSYTFNSFLADTYIPYLELGQGLYDIISKQLLQICKLNANKLIICPCTVNLNQRSLFPKLTIHTQGAKLVINSNDYLMPIDHQQCLAQIRRSPRVSVTAFMKFGSVLLNKYDVVFDQSRGRVGVNGEKMRRIDFDIEFWIYFIGDTILIIGLSIFQIILNRIKIQVSEQI